MIQHISFDVWNTIVKPNPEFAKYRTKFVAIALTLDEDFVKSAYTSVKSFVDGCAEKSDGAAFTTPEIYTQLFYKLGIKVSASLADEIRLTINELFKRYPPVIVDCVPNLFTWLREQGYTISIGSNSNFISGAVMHPFLEAQLGPLLYGVYSDLIVVAKPSIRFFDHVYEGVLLHHHDVLDRAHILHVGDNPVCDVQGAHSAGMHGLLINGPGMLEDQVKLRVQCENDFGVSFNHHFSFVE
jgi:putative hydrolase of the HAD superfamily